jgi:acetylornithine deacetylase
MSMDDSVKRSVKALLPDTQRFLSRLVGYPSVSGQEHEAMLFLREEFQRLDLEVESSPMSNALKSDPDYSNPVPGLNYEGRFNLKICRKGLGGGRSLLLNAHTDVVPPSEGMFEPWGGHVRDGILYGRGACDAKGQVATLYLVLGTLVALGIDLKGDVLGHVVVEEENGGNGTLAMIRKGEQADGCVVLEPSDRKLYTSIRGAVWFRLSLKGKAGHSGQAGQSRSALLMARDAIALLEQYHSNLLESSRGFRLFDLYPNPMPITFGRLEAGNWPASAPSEATLEGVLGLLPNKTKEEVCQEMHHVLAECDDEFLASNFDLSFMYRHDSSVLDPDHELPQTLLKSAVSAGADLEISGMTASCDAWFYNNQLKIPTVVYGPGSLAVAHSKDEQIAMSEIALAAEVLIRLILSYCNGEK